MAPVFDPLRLSAVSLDVLTAGRATPGAIAVRQKARLSRVLAAALRGSALYRERLKGLGPATPLAALPVVEQQALRARFAGLDRLYRDGWRLGPQLGAFYPALQPLLGYLPETQREPMLALLRQLDARQLGQLSRLSQRTPPQEREALRTELLALPAAGRAQWLQRRSEE